MGKKILFIFLMVFGLVLSSAQAADEDLKLCLEKSESLAASLNINLESSQSDKIGPCITNFVRINNPRLIVEEFERVNSCGFICRSKWTLLARTYNVDGYVDLIKERVKKDELEKVERVTGVSLRSLVSKDYSAIESYNAERQEYLNEVARTKGRIARKREERTYPEKEYGLPLLKSIVLAYSKLTLKSQALDLKIDKVIEVQQTVTSLEVEIEDCLKVVTTEEGLGLCVEKFEENAVYKIGKHTVDVYLNQYFENRIEEAKYSSFKQGAVEQYDVCSINYFFNERETVEKKSDKILPCVYNSLFESFIVVAEILVSKNSDMSQEDVKEVVTGLVDKCGVNSIVSLTGNTRFRALQKFSVDGFQEYLLTCQKSLTVGVVTQLGSASISEHPSVIEILGKARAKTFAGEVLQVEIPKCFDALGSEDEPEKCENYLFAKTASRIFPIVLEQKFNQFKIEFPFLTDDLITQSIAIAQVQLKDCQEKMYQDFRSFSEMESVKAEVVTAGCLRDSILSSLGKVVDVYIQTEIQNNKILIENGIVFGPSKKEQLKTDFFSCAALNISTSGGLKSVVDTSSTFLDKCILSLTKDVVLETFGTIVLENLLEVGLSSDQVALIYADYKKDPDNLLTAVTVAENTSVIERILAGAENKIIYSIAGDVIKYLILNKTPVQFEPEVIKNLSNLGAAQLITCLEKNELSVCAVQVETELMQKAVEVFLPKAAFEEFKEALKGVVSSEDIKSFGVLAILEKDIRTSQRGQELTAYIASEFSAGKTVEQIKKDPRIVSYITDVALEPIASDIIRKLIIKKSPIRFNSSEMKDLVASGKRILLNCLKENEASKCADQAEASILRDAVVIYLPKSVNDELKEALSDWFTSSQINSYRIEAKFKQSLTSGKLGTGVLNYIARELGKGTSTDGLRKLPRVTSYIYTVLNSYDAPGKSGLKILDHIAHNIIQKEINKFIIELNQGKHGGFFQFGFQIHFAGAKAKTAFDWYKSKTTRSGRLATDKFKSVFKRVIGGGPGISDRDTEALKELVKQAVLEYRSIAINQ